MLELESAELPYRCWRKSSANPPQSSGLPRQLPIVLRAYRLASSGRDGQQHRERGQDHSRAGVCAGLAPGQPDQLATSRWWLWPLPPAARFMWQHEIFRPTSAAVRPVEDLIAGAY
jgi:hypothetical protein